MHAAWGQGVSVCVCLFLYMNSLFFHTPVAQTRERRRLQKIASYIVTRDVQMLALQNAMSIFAHILLLCEVTLAYDDIYSNPAFPFVVQVSNEHRIVDESPLNRLYLYVIAIEANTNARMCSSVIPTGSQNDTYVTRFLPGDVIDANTCAYSSALENMNVAYTYGDAMQSTRYGAWAIVDEQEVDGFVGVVVNTTFYAYFYLNRVNVTHVDVNVTWDSRIESGEITVRSYASSSDDDSPSTVVIMVCIALGLAIAAAFVVVGMVMYRKSRVDQSSRV